MCGCFVGLLIYSIYIAIEGESELEEAGKARRRPPKRLPRPQRATNPPWPSTPPPTRPPVYEEPPPRNLPLPAIQAVTSSSAGSVELLHLAYPHHVAQLDDSSQRRLYSEAEFSQIPSQMKGAMRGIRGQEWSLQAALYEEAANTDFLLPKGVIAEYYESKIKTSIWHTMQWWSDNGGLGALFGGFGVSEEYKHSTWYVSGKNFAKKAMLCLLADKYYKVGEGKGHYIKECIGQLAGGFGCLVNDDEWCPSGRPMGHYYNDLWGGIASKDGYGLRNASTYGEGVEIRAGAQCWNTSNPDAPPRTIDFGNAVWNDHHYHYGYFIVAAAVLVKLDPDRGLYSEKHRQFIDFVETLIRDVANPSEADTYFPRFRNFDWFDLHSWSRGIIPEADGKDQESVSEEINLFWGLKLWGKVRQRPDLEELGTQMMAFSARTANDYFLFKTSTQRSTNFPDEVIKNHVAGTMYTAKMDYTTWFAKADEPAKINGIQMMPLSPALLLIRNREFCEQEFNDHLKGALIDEWMKLPWEGRAEAEWADIIWTGNVAFLDPVNASSRILEREKFDPGLTKPWALYWASADVGSERQSLKKRKGLPGTTSELERGWKMLSPVNWSDPTVGDMSYAFEHKHEHMIEPESVGFSGPISTNKFWANWVVNENIQEAAPDEDSGWPRGRRGREMPIHPPPYSLKLIGTSPTGGWKEDDPVVLQVSNGAPVWVENKEIVSGGTYQFDFGDNNDIVIASDHLASTFSVVEETLGGCVVEMKREKDEWGNGAGRILVPIVSGNAYISAQFTGAFGKSVRIFQDFYNDGGQTAAVTKVKPGIWRFARLRIGESARNLTDLKRETEWRVYGLDIQGNFLDDSYDWQADGRLSRRGGTLELEGWIRVARVHEPANAVVLDKHAQQIATGMDIELEHGGKLTYKFRTAFVAGSEGALLQSAGSEGDHISSITALRLPVRLDNDNSTPES